MGWFGQILQAPDSRRQCLAGEVLNPDPNRALGRAVSHLPQGLTKPGQGGWINPRDYIRGVSTESGGVVQGLPTVVEGGLLSGDCRAVESRAVFHVKTQREAGNRQAEVVDACSRRRTDKGLRLHVNGAKADSG